MRLSKVEPGMTVYDAHGNKIVIPDECYDSPPEDGQPLFELGTEVLNVTIHMAMRDAVLIEHPGCVAFVRDTSIVGEDPNLSWMLRAKEGQTVRIICMGEVIAEGRVMKVEPPGHTSRPDMQNFHEWYKLHYVLFPKLEV